MVKAAQAVASVKVLLVRGGADGACNRAHYAVFDAARADLMTSGTEIGKTHKGIAKAFLVQGLRVRAARESASPGLIRGAWVHVAELEIGQLVHEHGS